MRRKKKINIYYVCHWTIRQETASEGYSDGRNDSLFGLLTLFELEPWKKHSLINSQHRYRIINKKKCSLLQLTSILSSGWPLGPRRKRCTGAATTSSIFRWYFSISLRSSSQWPLHHSSICHTDGVELKAGKSSNKAREEADHRNPSGKPSDIARFIDKMSHHSVFPCLHPSSDWWRDCSTRMGWSRIDWTFIWAQRWVAFVEIKLWQQLPPD